MRQRKPKPKVELVKGEGTKLAGQEEDMVCGHPRPNTQGKMGFDLERTPECVLLPHGTEYVGHDS